METNKMKDRDEAVNQVDSETSDSEDEPKVFHEENLVIISSSEKISMMRWMYHLKNNWGRLMKENTRLLVLAGVHGKGRHQIPIFLFFYKVYKRPLTPPPPPLVL